MTSAEPQEQEQEPAVDGADPNDYTAVEAAIGAALAVMLIAWLTPGPSSFFDDRDSWRRQVADQLGQTLRNFIARSAFDLAQASGAANASLVAAEATAEVYPKVLGALERWSEVTLHHAVSRDQATAQAQSAAANLGRAVVSYARNESRDTTAGGLGAVWSQWRSRHDDRVRTTHRGLDGLAVPFGGHFVSESGALLRFPGDPQAPLEETMGCRCHLVYRLRPKKQDDLADV